jgi:hypothetical protein
MTKLKDMLPALSGLAYHMAHLAPGRYIAGLWERDLAYLLSWSRINELEGRESRRESLDSPSFSWVAAKYHVEWPSVYGEEFRPRCRLTAMEVAMATISSYGKVLNCSITARACVLSGPELFAYFVEQAMISLDLPENPGYYLDDMGRVRCKDENFESVICMELFYINGHNFRYMYVLLLQRTDGDN